MHVEKHRIAVRISQSGHDPLDGFFSLAPHSSGKAAYESMLELLNSSQRVIPFIGEGDGAVILLTRINLDWVMAGERSHRSLVLPRDFAAVREEPVELSFMNGTTIDGMIQIEETQTGCRASDCLNAAADFFPVLTRFGILLVNKSRVRETRLSGTTPGFGNPRDAAEQTLEGMGAEASAPPFEIDPPDARDASIRTRPGLSPRDPIA